MKKARSLLYPKGTYQTPSFFFRGGDEFKESEHLQSEYIAAKNDLKRAKKELQDARSEYEKVKSILDDKEGRAVALAESLGGSNIITTENYQYRRQIADLALEIDELQSKIAEARSHASIGTISALDRERSSYFLTIENLQVKYKELINNTQIKKMRLYEIFSSPKWHERSQLACEFEIAYRFHDYLKKLCKISFEQQNYAENSAQPSLVRSLDQNFFSTQSSKEPATSKDQISSQKVTTTQQTLQQDLQQLINQRMQLDMQCQEIIRQRYAMQVKRRVTISYLLNDIEKLDYALQDLGEEEIGVDDLRRSFLPDGPFSPIKMRKNSTSLSMPTSVSSTPNSCLSTRRPFTFPTPTAKSSSRVSSGTPSSVGSPRNEGSPNSSDGNSYFFGIQTICGSAKKSRKMKNNLSKTSSDHEKDLDA